MSDNEEIMNNAEETMNENVVNENAQGDGAKEIHEDKKKNGVLHEVIDFVKIVVIAFVVAYLLTHFVIVNAKVPTGSMNDTIETGARIVGNRLSYLFGEPERLDIIVFKAPDTPEENYVKRLIGLPGEKIHIEDSKILITTVDGKKITLKEDYLKEEWTDSNGPYDFEVPEGCYFMLGDNRNNSNDARKWKNTYVKRDAILSKVEFEYFPTLKWLG